MSVQFGVASFDGSPVNDRVRGIVDLLGTHAPDGLSVSAREDVTVLFGALHVQPHEPPAKPGPRVTRTGKIITWIGRLDDRLELIRELGNSVDSSSSDDEVFAAVYERWGSNCLAKILGDWAFSAWDPRERSLTLAKDFLGSEPLFYIRTEQSVAWSSLLDPLLYMPGGDFRLDLEYLAGWLSLYPATDRTPYLSIRSVAPGGVLTVHHARVERKTFWNFDRSRTIRYRADAEYEEHFRTLLAQSVRRRLRSSFPVLAELSGGMDSSSIVCMADRAFARGEVDVPRIDTVSFHADAEPDWNEAPFFSAVEEQRGRKGLHIPLDPEAIFRLEPAIAFSPIPGLELQDNEAQRQLAQYMITEGHRVVLSGLGGDEVLGGVPTPFPELENLLARGHLLDLAGRLKTWGLAQRKPWVGLFLESMRGFLPGFVRRMVSAQSMPWLSREFVRRQRAALSGYARRLQLLGPLPSFQENVATLEVLRRQIGCRIVPDRPPHQKRYPLLDRDLLGFLFAIPREQLVRPGERRSLQRRALRGLVPGMVLGRKRKAFASTSTMRQLARLQPQFLALTADMRASSLGIVEPTCFRQSFAAARDGQAISLPLLLRTLSLELWLRNLERRNAWSTAFPVALSNAIAQLPSAPNVFSAERIPEERRVTS